MNVMFFHLMPYADVDLKEAAKYDTAWVTFPNTNYDPIKGQALYNRYLDETVLAEELGYDGVCVNEHHQTSYGLMPSPIVISLLMRANCFAMRFQRANIACLRTSKILPMCT